MRELGVFYARFTDDWVVIAPTRWKLREAVRIANKTLNELKVEQHPDKTFIGRAERGSDFLGYFMRPGEIGASPGAVKRFAERAARLYEQGADDIRIGQYVLRWSCWLSAGLSGICDIGLPFFRILYSRVPSLHFASPCGGRGWM